MALIGRKNLAKAIDEIVDKKNKQLRSIFFQGLQNIQIGTPVDTGRARANWFFTDETPSSEVTTNVNGNRVSLSDLPVEVGNKTLFFTNNLPYIERLEFGHHSKQAPSGWVRTEIQFMRKAIRNI